MTQLKRMLMMGVLFLCWMHAFASITPQQLARFKKHHFLVLVYSAQCQFCQRFIPVVKQFEIQHQWPGVAFTIDAPSPLWPDVERLPNTLKKAWFGAHIQVPALFMYHDTGTIALVSIGYLDQAALTNRLSQFIENVLKSEMKTG